MHQNSHSEVLAPQFLAFESPLPASVLNIENKTRSNLLPWRGQFSPQLVSALLAAYAPKGGTVLDPFMGSGTVLAEAISRGHEVHGTEVNPAAISLARVYEFSRLTVTERRASFDVSEELLARIVGRPGDLFAVGVPPARSVTDPLAGIKDKRAQVLLRACLILSDTADAKAIPDVVWRNWSGLKRLVENLPRASQKVRAYLADARSVPLPDDSIDFVLTSPPYINVFNYHHYYRSAVESLGYRPLVVAHSEIGSNRKFRQNRFLTVVQYAMDIAAVLQELARVASKTCRIVFIVGRESAVHKTALYNSDIVAKIAADIGFSLCRRQERVFVNRYGQKIYEDLLHLKPSKSAQDADVLSIGRRTGIQALTQARSRVPHDRLAYLTDALKDADSVQASPLLDVASAAPKWMKD